MDEQRVRTIVRKENKWLWIFYTALLALMVGTTMYQTYDVAMTNQKIREVNHRMLEVYEQTSILNKESQLTNQQIRDFYRHLQDRLE